MDDLLCCFAGWHLCNFCQRNAVFMCYTCPYSLCKKCLKQADIFCVRGNKGFCKTCMTTIMLIENIPQETKEQVWLLYVWCHVQISHLSAQCFLSSCGGFITDICNRKLGFELLYFISGGLFCWIEILCFLF